MIIQVLNNGLLVDPHDQNAIADALYKLLSDKQLWLRCRDNGLKNIHQFSWPEHCKNYLSRILTLGPRSPAIGNKEEQRNAPMSGRNHMIVFSVDSVNKEDLVRIIRNSMEVIHTEKKSDSTGFVLSTSLTISEIHSLLVSAGMLPTDFDAFICNCGSNIYYPSYSGETPSNSKVTFVLNQNHQSHIEYRWGGEGLRKYLVKWATSVVERKGRIERQIIFEDSEHSSAYCLTFKVVNPNHVSLLFSSNLLLSRNLVAWWAYVPHHFKYFVSFYSYFFDMRKILTAAASFERVEEVDEDPITPLQCSI
jgi:sucrose-phosphate synthase